MTISKAVVMSLLADTGINIDDEPVSNIVEPSHPPCHGYTVYPNISHFHLRQSCLHQ